MVGGEQGFDDLEDKIFESIWQQARKQAMRRVDILAAEEIASQAIENLVKAYKNGSINLHSYNKNQADWLIQKTSGDIISLKAYMATIVKHCCDNEWKNRHPEISKDKNRNPVRVTIVADQKLTTDFDEPSYYSDEAADKLLSVEEAVIIAENIDQILSYINTFPTVERQVWLTYLQVISAAGSDFYGSKKAVANKLGISESLARVNINHGRVRLKAFWQAQEDYKQVFVRPKRPYRPRNRENSHQRKSKKLVSTEDDDH